MHVSVRMLGGTFHVVDILDVTSHQAKTSDSLQASPGAAVRQGVLELLAGDNMRSCDGTHDRVPTSCLQIFFVTYCIVDATR